ncbi:MAG TPA: Crp/Fnr family transcriptional regulator [Pyrinomonadaceae bacterium]|nr:Crp/Fnr family transcriptional regulator [Pyrinomonadaceae bacterium]
MPSQKESRFPAVNKILAALPRQEYAHLFAQLEPTHLARSKVLYEFGDPVRQAYFVTNGMVSLLSIAQNGATTEVSMVGNEGMLGVPIILGVDAAPYRVMVQLPGAALRLRAEVLRREFQRGGPLQALVLRYIHLLILQISQSASCNRFHTIEQRLCRWLLISRDRINSDRIDLTQEALSHMLGAPRSRVSLTVGTLKRAGLIQHARGSIVILDRTRLEMCACECYKVVTAGINYLRAA